MLYDWSMESNYSSVFSAAYFAKRNLNGGGFQSEGAAEGGCGGNSAAPERLASGASQLVGVLRKMGSDFFKQTPHVGTKRANDFARVEELKPD
jgi:hypothetical protein